MNHFTKRYYFLFSLVLLGLSAFFTSCEKDDLSPSNADNNALIEEQLASSLAAQFAIQLGDAMQYPEVRSFVKEKVMLQFDGDYDFLIAFEKDASIQIADRPDVRKFRDIFDWPEDMVPIQKSTSDFISALLEEEPLLQVHIPELWENSTIEWDETSFIPQVACLNLVEVDKGPLPTYNSVDNSWGTVSGITAPDEVTIVISQNERIIHSKGPYTGPKNKSSNAKNNCILLEPVDMFGDDYYYDYLDVEDFDNCNGFIPPFDPPSPPTEPELEWDCGNADRDSDNGDDQVSLRGFRDMDGFRRANEWFDGEHEVRVHITFGNVGNGPTTVRKSWFGRSNDFRSCSWFSCDVINFNGAFQDVLVWDPTIQGSIMHYFWEEVDGGHLFDISFSFAPKVKVEVAGVGVEVSTFAVEVKIPIANNSDRLGERIVEYCDRTSPPSSYETHSIRFQVRQ